SIDGLRGWVAINGMNDFLSCAAKFPDTRARVRLKKSIDGLRGWVAINGMNDFLSCAAKFPDTRARVR
ncbi:hypothetical protein VS884_26525, partial [Escherichia coli]